MKYREIVKLLVSKTVKDTKRIVKGQSKGLKKAFQAYMKETN